MRGDSYLRVLSRCVAAAGVALWLSASCFAASEKYGIGLDGKAIGDLGGPGIHAVVLVFAASDCPISNRYIPEIARLNKEYSTRGVRFWWVFPNAEDNAAVVKKHDLEFGIHEDALLDVGQDLVKRAQVGVTPEAAVFVVEGAGLREVYHGRVDDRYLSLGQERPQPERHDLELAIVAALAGKPVEKPQGPAVGCSIVFRQK